MNVGACSIFVCQQAFHLQKNRRLQSPIFFHPQMHIIYIHFLTFAQNNRSSYNTIFRYAQTFLFSVIYHRVVPMRQRHKQLSVDIQRSALFQME